MARQNFILFMMLKFNSDILEVWHHRQAVSNKGIGPDSSTEKISDFNLKFLPALS